MPYLSGPNLCDISNKFGLSVSYSWRGAQSRWQYLDDLLTYCITNKKCSDLLSFLFSKKQFENMLKGLDSTIVGDVYTKIINKINNQINGILYFNGYKLIKTGSVYEIHEISSEIPLDMSSIKKIDSDYTKDILERALNDIADGNLDSAITKARTLLEEVFIHVIEKKNATSSCNGDIKDLYKQVKQLYNMHPNKDLERCINELLSGLEKIVSSIAEMRNKGSDAHGLGTRRTEIKAHHARLFVNSAITMSDFILAICEEN